MVSALVIVDVQQGMFAQATPLYRGEEIAARLGALLQRARDEGVTIFHIRHDGGVGHGLAKGSPGWLHHPTVTPHPGETIIDKRQSSAFHGTDFHERLRAVGIKRLIIGGMQTQMCVESTLRGALALGYKIDLIEDGHTTYDTPVLNAAQIIAHHNHTASGRFATLVNAADVDFHSAIS